MQSDISHLLENWDYEAGKIVVRRVKGRDGSPKIQLRVDLGILQMNTEGRPDGKRPFGHDSYFDFLRTRAEQDTAGGKGPLVLRSEEVTRLQMECLQYHHRYICLHELGEFPAVIRDTNRNLAAFDFAIEHAENDELSWALDQLRPQVILMRTRAVATAALQESRHTEAMTEIEQGLTAIREFYSAWERPDLIEQSAEMQSLEVWLGDVRERRPLTRREKLELDLADAVNKEDYERAARVRDELRKLTDVH